MCDKFDFEKNVGVFYNKLLKKENDRYLSWEHCYLFFLNFKDKKENEKDYDLAALNLAFYLASWGMYRGSSFLLQYDYKIHTELIKKIFSDKEYIENVYDYEKYTWTYVEKLKTIITNYFKEKEQTPSDTLITKIMMGIFGCTPAFDRFFVDGLKRYVKDNNIKNGNKRQTSNFSEETFEFLKKFYDDHKIQNVYHLKTNNNVEYPPMKLVDMFFWQIGYNNSFKAIEIDTENHKITFFKRVKRSESNYYRLEDSNKDEIKEKLLGKRKWKVVYSSNEDDTIDDFWLQEFLNEFLKCNILFR